jgi:hypothetical protein
VGPCHIVSQGKNCELTGLPRLLRVREKAMDKMISGGIVCTVD